MSPPMAIPGHITALYVFAIINLMVMCHFTMVEANVYVLDQRNFSVYEAEDKMAKFGGQLPDRGLRGYLQPTIPQNACTVVKEAPPQSTYPWIALIQRNGCDFSFKVYMAQRAGYTAAIVYNIGSDELVPMGAGKDSDKVHIPSVFIGAHDGEVLRNLSNDSVFQHTVLIFPHFSDLPLRDMLVPFIICVGICCLIMIGVLVGKWVRDWRKRRKARLSKQNLKKLPVKKFKKGDEYDMCAICLDEYEDGDKLRILPCQHAYHMKCVDPWLLNNRRVCPVCKRKVIPGDDSDSNSDSEDESNGNETTNERTPLLAPQDQNASRPRSFFSRTFENSGLPESMRDEVRTAGSAAPVSDDDGSTTSPSPQGGGHSVQSTVDVHHSGEHEEPSARRPSVDLVNEGQGPNKAAKSRLHRKKRSSRIKVKRPQPCVNGQEDEQARSPLDHPTTHRPTEPLVPPGGSINCDDYEVRVVTGEEQQADGEELGAVGGLDHPLVTLVDDHFAQEPVETPQVADEQTASDTEVVPKVRSSTKIKKKRKRRKRDEEA